jgi:glycine cleavage system H protein
MNVPSDLRYVKSHEWVRLDGDVATVGITDHAQDQLGEVVYVDMPDEGDEFEAGGELGEIESSKAVSAIYAPVSGEVVAVNDALEDEPETVNSSPYDGGWLVKIKVSDPSEVESLLDAAAYAGVLEAAE